MPLFKYPTERVALKLRVPPGQFTSKPLEAQRVALRLRQEQVADGPRCKVCGAKHHPSRMEFDHHFVPTRISV
jgi:uncharacterized OB-fold protein